MKKKVIRLLLSVVVLAMLLIFAGPGWTAVVDPEDVDFGDYIALTKEHIYYSTDGNIELKCTELAGEVYGRVIKGGGFPERQRYLINCDGAPYPRSAMVSDGNTTFFITYVENVTAHALFSRAADGSGKPEQLTLDLHLAPRALVLDNGYVYYASLEGAASTLYRRDANTGVIDMVAALGAPAGDSINAMTVDETYVYWTEGADGGVGRVRRVLKTGGAPAVVADGLALPWDLTTDANRVYWTELEGARIGSRAKNGAGAIETVFATDRPVTTLYLDGTMIYFGTGNVGARNGAVYRMKANGSDLTLMTYGFPPPKDIVLAGGWVYWVDGKLKRVAPNAVSDPVDYGIEWMEVTQGVQDGDHTVPLVRARPTFVRLYARELSGTGDDSVRAKLYGYRDGVPLNGSPISPIANGLLDLGPDRPSRADINQTFLFRLPDGWMKLPDFELQARVNPGNLVFETDYGNNAYPSIPEAYEINNRVSCLVTYPVAATTPAGATVIFDNDPEIYDPRMNRARTLQPYGISLTKSSTVIWLEEGDGDPVPHTLPADPNEGMLLAAIGETGSLSDAPGGCIEGATRYGGIIDETADFVAGFGGRASDNQWWARWWDAGSAFDYILPAGGFLWAHENAHTLGRPHVDCGGAAGPGFYPYPPCQNDFNDDEDAAWGYDPISGAAPNPVDNPDLMAYGAPRWVSDFTWRCLYDFISDAMGLPGSGMAGCNDPLLAHAKPQTLTQELDVAEEDAVVYLRAMIRGTDLELTSLISYDSFDQLTTAQQAVLRNAPRSGEYYARLLNSRGQAVDKKYATTGEHIHDSAGKSFDEIVIVMRRDSSVEQLEIRETETDVLLYSQTISENVPQIKLNSVAVNRDGDMVVDFKAEDADGDPLKIVAQYMGPEGRKEVMFHTRGPGQASFRCDPCTWPGRTLHGGSGAVRIIASDGLQTAMMEKAVVVPNKPPEVSITAAQHGVIDQDGFATFGVWASVWDAESGVDPEDLVWIVSSPDRNTLRERMRVTGEQVIFLSRDNALDEDSRSTVVKVDLQVTDGRQQTTASIEVELQPEKESRLLLPIVMSGN